MIFSICPAKIARILFKFGLITSFFLFLLPDNVNAYNLLTDSRMASNRFLSSEKIEYHLNRQVKFTSRDDPSHKHEITAQSPFFYDQLLVWEIRTDPVRQIAQAGDQTVPVTNERTPEDDSLDLSEIFRERSALTPEEKWVFQPSLEYSHSSASRVAVEGFVFLPSIIIGAIDVRRISRDTIISAFTFRYGLAHRLEFEFRLPYVYRKEFTASRPVEIVTTEDIITDIESSGLGDLEFGLRYQLNRQRKNKPLFIGNLRIKTRTGLGPLGIESDPITGIQRELSTGSGFWAIGPSLTIAFPADPAVLFTNLSYLWNIKRRTGLFGEIDPGDAYGFSLGMGFSINEKVSFNLGYQHTIVGKTRREGAIIASSATSHVGSLLLGFNYRLNKKRSLNFSVVIGATEDAPDVRLIVRFPFSR
jgi:hypothetical protein